jgi:hypothetical protein
VAAVDLQKQVQLVLAVRVAEVLVDLALAAMELTAQLTLVAAAALGIMRKVQVAQALSLFVIQDYRRSNAI